jgi:pimeloyl-ACP methyl ester carboxylesterase
MTTTLPHPAPVQFIDTSVGQVAIRRTPMRGGGAHEPALLVHGLGGNALNWVDLAEELADQLDCVALDLPGFGSTPPPEDADYSIAAHTRAVVAVIEAVFPGQAVHLFGNSMGGAIAVQVAARHPELVKTLCLVAPAMPTRRPRATNVHIPVMTLPRVGPRLFERYQRVGPDKRVQATFDLCYADPARLHPQRRAEAEAEATRRDQLPWIRDAFIGSSKGLLATFLDRGPERPWALAGWVQAPTLLVYGLKDKLVDAKDAHRVTRAFPNAHVMVLADSGHIAMMEHPDLVARWWEEFLG